MAAPDPRDARLISALDECIARMAHGEPLESALSRFPELADALRPMLEAGVLVRRAQPDAREVMAARERARFYVQRQLREPVRRRMLFPARALMSVAALVLIALVGALFFAERSLPGDSLYGLKRASENVRTALGGADFSERRIDETLALMAAGRPAEVTFQGRVAAMSDVLWAVGGVPLLVNDETVIAPGIGANDLVEVRARVTEAGQAIAVEIRLVAKGTLPVPTATSTFTPPPSPTWTPTSTPSSSPTGTPSATVSPSPTPSWTATASPSSTPTYTPTPTATPSATRTLTPTSTPSRTPSKTPSHTPSRTPTPLPPVNLPTNPPPIGNDNANDNGDDNGGNDNNGNDDHSGGSGSGRGGGGDGSGNDNGGGDD